MRFRVFSVVTVLSAFLIHASVASAKAPVGKDKKATTSKDKKAAEKPVEEEPPPPEPETAPEASEAPKEEAQPAEETQAKPADTASDEADALTSPVEEPGKTYRFVGLRYRGVIVPKFILNVFGDGGETVYAHSFGPEFGIRKDGFEYDFALMYTPYTMGPTPFKSSTDAEDAWEVVESHIKVLYITADFLWSHPISPQVAFTYGGGAGLGLVFGSLVREQAYKNADGEYVPCAGVGNPNASYCGNDNDHYNGYEEPSWANGGSKPVIFPWLALQTGLRYKPHRNFVGHFDVGLGLGQFFFGLGADYGL